MGEATLLELIEWAQHPLDTCAGQPVIPAYNFKDIASTAVLYSEVVLSESEILDVFAYQAKRFTACGANHSDTNRFGVVRKNPKTGWSYLIDILTGNTKESD